MPANRPTGPSCFDRVKTGALMGCAVGLSAGALFGTFGALRYGLRGREFINQVGRSMVEMGGTFGLLLAIGTAIRC